MKEVVIVSAVRSAVGKGQEGRGARERARRRPLGARDAAGDRQGRDRSRRSIDDVYWGCAMPEATQGLNVARLAWLRAGLPVDVPAATVNRFCSSGLQTVALARAGDHERHGRRRARRRRRDDEPGADVRLSHAARSGDHRVVHRHGLHRRARGGAVEGDARGSGPLGARKPAEGSERAERAARSTVRSCRFPSSA